MPSPLLTNALRFLHRRTVSTFAGESKIWWPAARGLSAYTVSITCAAAPVKQSGREMPGLLTMPMDGQVFHCAAADFPFPPRPDMVFVFGPVGPAGECDTASSRKFLITAADAYGEHITLTATDHGPAAA